MVQRFWLPAMTCADPAQAAISKAQVPIGPQLTQKPVIEPPVELVARPRDKLNGPVTYSVGGTGAKKQILIPKGEWMVLASVDHNMMIPSSGLSREMLVRFSTIALAKFDSTRTSSILVVTFNRTVTPTTLSSWPDAVKCEGNEAPSFYSSKEGDFTLRRCSFVRAVADKQLRESAVPNLWQDVDASLRGLSRNFGQFNIESSIFVVDRRDYLHIARFDCTQLKADGLGCEPIPDSTKQPSVKSPNVEARISWAKAYLPFAVAGFKSNLDDGDSLTTSQAKTQLPD
jgi:hypothetical protein